MTRFSTAAEAILLMLAAMVSFSAMNTLIRVLSDSLHSTEIVLLRNLFSLLLIILWQFALHRGVSKLRTKRIGNHFWRASVGFVAMELWFYAVTLMPLTLATALSFSTPIFATIFAILFLGEKAGMRRWSAIGIGLVGMMVILRPGTGDIGPHALFVLASSAMMAVASILVKTLTRTETPETIVFYMALFMVPWSVLPVIGHWQAPTGRQLELAFAIALFSTISHLMLTRAYIRADMVMLMPFDFTRLIFTALFAYACFGETLDMPTIAGSLLIVGSAVYIAHREARKKRFNG